MTWLSLQQEMLALGYVASDELSMALHLSMSLGRPLLLEGAAGVGKTEVAKMLTIQSDVGGTAVDASHDSTSLLSS